MAMSTSICIAHSRTVPLISVQLNAQNVRTETVIQGAPKSSPCNRILLLVTYQHNS